MGIGENGDVDGDQSFLVEEDWVLMTVEEIKTHINPPLTEAQLKELASQKRDADMLLGDTYELDGVSYQISLTKDDGDGMIQVKVGFDLGLTSTIVQFKNGTNIPITPDNFPEFSAWFVNARNKFFI